MWFTRFGDAPQLLTRGAGEATEATRVPPGHPEGYLEGFATLYGNAAELISGRDTGALLPGLQDGLDGMWFIAACLESSRAGGRWVVHPEAS
jgi:predicted dehydrogenase